MLINSIEGKLLHQGSPDLCSKKTEHIFAIGTGAHVHMYTYRSGWPHRSMKAENTVLTQTQITPNALSCFPL